MYKPLTIFLALCFLGCDARTESTGADRATLNAHLKAAADAVERGQYGTAESEYQAALAAVDHGGFSAATRIGILQSAARVKAVQGEHAAAESLYMEVVAALEVRAVAKLVGDAEHIQAMGSLASLRFARGDVAGAEDLFLRILDMGDRGELSLGPHQFGLAATLHGLARVASSRGQAGRADSLSKRATGLQLYAEAFDLYTDGRLEDAEASYRRALGVQRQSLGPLHPDVALTSSSLGVLLAARQRHESAVAAFESSVQAYETHPALRYELGVALDYMAESLRHTDRSGEADEIAERSERALAGL